MQIQITQVTDVKTNEYGPSSKIHAGSNNWFVNEDATQYVGKTVEISEENKTSKQGRQYKIAKILSVLGDTPAPVAASGNSNGNGKVEWREYVTLAREAHKLALELEPDTEAFGEHSPGVAIDRSRARVTFVNTALMALKDGKLWLDDDIPF